MVAESTSGYKGISLKDYRNIAWLSIVDLEGHFSNIAKLLYYFKLICIRDVWYYICMSTDYKRKLMILVEIQ